MNIKFSNEIAEAAPELEVLVVTADVLNGPTNSELWSELSALSAEIKEHYQINMINKRPGILATRLVYKALGKDPNRYRPSTESLCRRMVKGMELYRSLSLIDLINLASVKSGHSIGGFDADKIEGDTITLGVGRANEPYEGIGRGLLNIEGLPVFRDAKGGIGTPTSDNERTKLSEETTRLLMTVNMYAPEMDHDELIALITRLLIEYGNAKNITFSSHRPTRM
jgi:DNA/RNA-binding domain of Phe-tRNA-synthetase-like protein